MIRSIICVILLCTASSSINAMEPNSKPEDPKKSILCVVEKFGWELFQGVVNGMEMFLVGNDTEMNVSSPEEYILPPYTKSHHFDDPTS